MRLDHVSYAVSAGELASTVGALGARLGGVFRDGGVHPRFGTRNFVLPLDGGCYVEVVAPLEHPSGDRLPFGRAVRERAAAGGGWLAWVVAVEDVGVVERRLGRSAAEGHRVRPDGFDLRWQQIGLLDVLADPQLPFFVQWLVDPAELPSAGPPAGSPRLTGLEIRGDEERVGRWLSADGGWPLPDVAVTWVDGSSPGLAAVEFAAAQGRVRIE